MPDFIHFRILEVKIPNATATDPDYPISSFEANNKFSLVFAYSALTSKRKPQQSLDWLWKGTCTPKIKFFLWLAWWNRLPTNQLLQCRNIIPSPLCPLCSLHVESSIHTLRDCRVASEVWALAKITLSTSPLMTSEEWLRHHLSSSILVHNVLQNLLFSSLCWELWTQRNKFIFEASPIPTPNNTLQNAKRMATHIHSSLPNPILSSNHIIPQVVSLSPHPWLHLFVDASYISLSSYTCIAGVLIDCAGQWVTGFQRLLFANSPLQAELLSIQWCLVIAQEFNVGHLKIFTDCARAAYLLNRTDQVEPLIEKNVALCRDLSRAFQRMKVQLCPRKLNQAADKLAKDGRKNSRELNVTKMIPTPPSYILNIWDDFVLRLSANTA